MITKENITTLIPHRFPIIMIDNLLEHNEHYTVTNFKVEADNIFVKEGEFQEAGIIENIAQSAAAGAGYYYSQHKLPQPLTYIASISKLKINKYPEVGSLVNTRIELEATVLSVNIVIGKCFIDKELIAECEMKVVIDNSHT